MKDFWYVYKFTELPYKTYDGEIYKDLYSVVSAEFDELYHVIVYVCAQIVLAFHLSHGFQSAFQTLGLNHPKYTPLIKGLGNLYAILIPLGFAIIPILMYLN
jgi:succinate dehydrogenase / fumarate reductase cytochrome b subunit